MEARPLFQEVISVLNWVIGWLRKCVEVLIEYLLELLAGDINNNGDSA